MPTQGKLRGNQSHQIANLYAITFPFFRSFFCAGFIFLALFSLASLAENEGPAAADASPAVTASAPDPFGGGFSSGTDSYEFVQEIARGGGGVVYLFRLVGSEPPKFFAFKTFIGLPVARREHKKAYVLMNSFDEETKNKHDQIPFGKPMAVNTRGGRSVAGVLMRYMPENLLDLVKETRLTRNTPKKEIDERIRKLEIVGDQIFRGVGQFESLELAHLDVKPTNFLIPGTREELWSGKIRLQLSDHDTAKKYGQLPRAIGTYGYLPPEVVGVREGGRGNYTVQPAASAYTDRYAAGMTWYTMVFGRSAQVDFMTKKLNSTDMNYVHSWAHDASSLQNYQEFDDFIVQRFDSLIKELNPSWRQKRRILKIRDRILGAIHPLETLRTTDGKIERPIESLKPTGFYPAFRKWCGAAFFVY